MSEFDVIEKYFSFSQTENMLGIGDDCALFNIPLGEQIAISKDLLVEGHHFFSDADPISLGHKSLAVNLSDLAAMGATPIGCLLGIALPKIDHVWLSKFSKGFFNLSDNFCCPLLGGDTVKSNQGVVISVTVFGRVPIDKAIRRNRAQLGDEIWISGNLGSADVAYRIISKKIAGSKILLERTIDALNRPFPRISLGKYLLGIANSAIDISDGLVQDLSHITRASNLGAHIYYDKIPFDNFLIGKLSQEDIKKSILYGGDVYELCFTVPESKHDAVKEISNNIGISLNVIGRIVDNKKVSIFFSDGAISNDIKGFNHF